MIYSSTLRWLHFCGLYRPLTLHRLRCCITCPWPILAVTCCRSGVRTPVLRILILRCKLNPLSLFSCFCSAIWSALARMMSFLSHSWMSESLSWTAVCLRLRLLCFLNSKQHLCTYKGHLRCKPYIFEIGSSIRTSTVHIIVHCSWRLPVRHDSVIHCLTTVNRLSISLWQWVIDGNLPLFTVLAFTAIYTVT